MGVLSVHLVTWNGAKYMPYVLDSLKRQSYKNWELVILDNGSTDSTIADCRLQIADFPAEVKIIENKENIGFANGHNQLASYMLHDTCYMLLLNQDMYLMPDCLEKLIDFMDKNEDVAAVSPRLMKWDFDGIRDTGYGIRIEESFTNKIDSLGLRVFRNRRVVEKYTGKDWEVIKPKMKMSFRNDNCAKEVFGVSGALPMIRKSVIDEIGLLDESFGSYKEDVDLAFRLRLAGYKAFVILDSVAYHDRSAMGLEKTGDRVAMKNKKTQSEWVKYHSYKNHLLALYKNEYWQNLLLDLPWILWYELKKFIWFLLFDKKILKGLGEIWKLKKDLKIKRLKIKNLRKIGWREMRIWFK